MLHHRHSRFAFSLFLVLDTLRACDLYFRALPAIQILGRRTQIPPSQEANMELRHFLFLSHETLENNSPAIITVSWIHSI